jgi:hypothetical protein
MGKEVESTEEQRRAFGEALEAAMHSASIHTYRDVSKRLEAVGIDRHGNNVGKWCKGDAEPRRAEVAALELICAVAPGHLSRHLGYVPVNVSTDVTIEQLILASDEFTADDKRVLLTLVEKLRAVQP